MKKFKKISAILMASVITSVTISAMTAGAVKDRIKVGANVIAKDDLKEILEDAYMIPADSILSTHKRDIDVLDYPDRLFVLETENERLYDIYCVDWAEPDYISASLESDVDSDALIAAMKEICPDAEVVNVTQDTDCKTVCVKGMDDSNRVRLPYDKVIKSDITYDQVIKIYDLLNETGKLKSCTYTKPSVRCSYTFNSFVRYVPYSTHPNLAESLQDYIAENNLDWTVLNKEGSSTLFVTTEERMTAEESVKISEQIYADLDIRPFVPFFTDLDPTPAEDTVIDMHNNLKGDANDDGELRLSDAILILQSIGNPDEYQLTPQGKYNADIYGDRDGITTMDAVAVQRKILGLE